MILSKDVLNMEEHFSKKLTLDDDVEDLQKLCESCSKYYRIMEGKTVPSTAGEEVFFDLPKGKQPEDKTVIGVYSEEENLLGIIDMIKDFPRKNIWFIGLMMIDPKKRSQGLGEEMVKNYINLAKDNGIAKIKLGVLQENEGAVRFWDKLGFKITKEISNYKINKKTTTVYAMDYDIQ